MQIIISQKLSTSFRKAAVLKKMFCFHSTEKTTEAKMMKAGGTEIGKTLAEKSRGLFSANDWQCKTYVSIMNSKGQRV